jgi:predicted amidohydrolase
MGKGQEAVIEIACIQMKPVVGGREANLRKSLGMIEEAADHGSRLIVLAGAVQLGLRVRKPRRGVRARRARA